ncbi:START domain-containing protein [Paraflavitalea speifideaquila]|uniref:START domain-containing protein n=1 Tax=Paraflavitalea speifideaquila TaxID=3076558 RepID=UPI0028E1CC40|nr:START domain-containing protein [Paraflavitalea speifideiaquila]
MKNVQVLGCLLLMLVQSLYAGATGEGEFKLVKQDEVLSLYERWIPGGQGEQVREIKAVFIVRSDVESVINLLIDQAKGKEWNTNARKYNVLHTGNRTNWITYTRYSVPWPFGDQDCCLSYNVHKESANPRMAVISFESALNNQFPVTTSVTRITGTKGKWLLEDAGYGHMKISYIVSSHRSKKVPRWIADPIVRNNLFTTMTTFKSILEKKRILVT